MSQLSPDAMKLGFRRTGPNPQQEFEIDDSDQSLGRLRCRAPTRDAFFTRDGG
jgi:hypothetical protein